MVKKILLHCNYKTFIFISILCLPLYPCRLCALTIHTPVQEGSLIQGTLQKDERLFFNQTEIIPNSNGLFYFGLPQDFHSPLKLVLKTPNHAKTVVLPVQNRQWQEQYINNLPPAKVNIKPSHQKRIQQENALLFQNRQHLTKDFFPTCFIRPVKKPYRISGQFGNRRIFNKQIKAGHSGTDYAQPINTPVYAMAKGRIVLTHEDMFLSGKTVLVDHGYGIFSSYSHLNQIDVENGQIVNQGQIIGKIGQTGRATGPHLHFTITWHQTRIDPEFVFDTFQCITK
ncbi:MAG: M23 family metallopeptidase [Alphaproteobacteria bacterium]|nr:M23 family metallopeptidase [Alphaproteobacteria bacterium]